jgi:hypothetical protein
MPERNLQEAEQLLQEMQAAVQAMRNAISDTDNKPPPNYVPLK